jgi:hypothetical protein
MEPRNRIGNLIFALLFVFSLFPFAAFAKAEAPKQACCAAVVAPKCGMACCQPKSATNIGSRDANLGCTCVVSPVSQSSAKPITAPFSAAMDLAVGPGIIPLAWVVPQTSSQNFFEANWAHAPPSGSAAPRAPPFFS